MFNDPRCLFHDFSLVFFLADVFFAVFFKTLVDSVTSIIDATQNSKSVLYFFYLIFLSHKGY